MEVETTKDFGADDAAVVKRWVAENEAYNKAFGAWEKRAQAIVKRYRDDRDSERDDGRKINILWSNVQTLQPAIYGNTPKPEVARRNKDKDDVGRAAAEILERCVEYEVEVNGYDDVVRAVRDDYLLTGRGQAWIRYNPTFGPEEPKKVYLPDGKIPEGAKMDGDRAYIEGEPFNPVVDEEVIPEHIHWKTFAHSPAPSWTKVTWVRREELLTRAELVKKFGQKIGGAVPLKHTINKMDQKKAASFGDVFMRAKVWEIWDKPKREVLWICPDYPDGPLKREKDPLHLQGFFPCPKPLYGTTTTDSLVPVPDYIQYQSQAQEIDELTERIHLLTKALRVAGVYDGEFAQLENLVNGAQDNVLIPVMNWASFQSKGGFDGAVSFMPISDVAAVLVRLTEMRAQTKQDLYETTGISDIVRGASDPRETMGAQAIKSRFAGLRLEDRQKDAAIFARGLLRLMAEVVSEHFSPDTLSLMSGYMRTPGADLNTFKAAAKLLRDDKMRTFRLDIEADSTVAQDQDAEQENRVKFLSAVTPFLEKVIPAADQYPELKPVFSEMLMFGVRGFKAGRQLEGAFDDAIDGMKDGPDIQGMIDQAKQRIAEEQRTLDEQKMAFEKEVSTAQLEERKLSTAEAVAAEQRQIAAEDRQNKHAFEMAKLGLMQTEATIRLKNMENSLIIDQQKIEDSRAARQEARDEKTAEEQAVVNFFEKGEEMDKLAEQMAAMAEQMSQVLMVLAQSSQATQQAMESMAAVAAAPKELVRDENGRPVGVRTVLETVH